MRIIHIPGPVPPDPQVQQDSILRRYSIVRRKVRSLKQLTASMFWNLLEQFIKVRPHMTEIIDLVLIRLLGMP